MGKTIANDEFERLMAARCPPITVMYPNGDVKDLPHDIAKKEIAFGTVTETVPSDPVRAKQWIADLRARVMDEAKRNAGYLERLRAFEEFETWCDGRGLRALPVTAETLVLYLISSADDGVAEHVLRQRCNLIVTMHDLTRHPPRNLAKTAWDAYIRAISFAQSALLKAEPSMQDLEQRRRRKALQMFSDGRVPLRWSEVANAA